MSAAITTFETLFDHLVRRARSGSFGDLDRLMGDVGLASFERRITADESSYVTQIVAARRRCDPPPVTSPALPQASARPQPAGAPGAGRIRLRDRLASALRAFRDPR